MQHKYCFNTPFTIHLNKSMLGLMLRPIRDYFHTAVYRSLVVQDSCVLDSHMVLLGRVFDHGSTLTAWLIARGSAVDLSFFILTRLLAPPPRLSLSKRKMEGDTAFFSERNQRGLGDERQERVTLRCHTWRENMAFLGSCLLLPNLLKLPKTWKVTGFKVIVRFHVAYDVVRI